MTYRMLLPYTGLENEVGAIGFAARLAELVHGEVDALFVSRTLVPLAGREQEGFDHIVASEGLATANQFLSEFYRTQHKKRAAVARQTFEQVIGGLPAKDRFSWYEQPDVFQEVEPILRKEGFLHDLALCSFAMSSPLLDAVVQEVLLATGRPALFVAPKTAMPADLTVIVAWKAVPATVRAVTAALPLLRAARKCIVVSIDEEERTAGASAAEFASYLARSDIQAEPHAIARDGQPAQSALESFYRQAGADLIVMGAYSQSRLKQFVFGGFTKHFLGQRSCTVLMTA